MSVLLLSIHHRVHGLAAVERAQAHAEPLRTAMRATGAVRGEVELATCNRHELYLDVEPGHAAEVAHAYCRALGTVDAHLPRDPLHATQTDALAHLFQVTAGLDSLVIGEREISGQVKRAVADARAAGTLTHQLDVAFTEALRTARRVQTQTNLSATGRSIVAVALDLAQIDVERPVLVVGTGAYAGATVAALRGRGADDLWVHSVSGRAEGFARSHGMTVVEDLADAARACGAIVCCSGHGAVLTPALVEGGADLAVVDLALSHDVDPAVRDVPGVRLVDLADVQAFDPGLADAELTEARGVIAEGLAELTDSLNDRRLAPAVTAMRSWLTDAVDDEVARLGEGPLSRDEAAQALRRLAARLAHVPILRAREAARSGHADDYVAALDALLGIDSEVVVEDAWELDLSRLETERCPVTGLAVDDLAGLSDEG